MKNIKNDIKNNSFKPYYLIHGDEAYLINQFKDNFRFSFNENKEFNNIYFNKENYDEIKLVDALVRMPFFSNKKLIIIENVNISTKKIKEALERSKDINVVVYVLNDDLYKNKEYQDIIKFFTQNGYECAMDVQDDEMIFRHIRQLIIENNKSIKDADIYYIIKRVGNDLYNINNELNKIISYVGSRTEINREDIDKVTHESISDTAFTLINYINNGDMKGAYETYGKLIEDQVEPMVIYGAIKYNYNAILQVKSLQIRELNNKDVMALAKIKSKYQYEKISEAARKNSMSFFIKKMENLYKCNKMFMSGDINKKIWIEVMISE